MPVLIVASALTAPNTNTEGIMICERDRYRAIITTNVAQTIRFGRKLQWSRRQMLLTAKFACMKSS